jgi:hypothetical protein
MKAIMRWVGDPYIHLFTIGLVLVRFSMAMGEDQGPSEALDPPSDCHVCGGTHGSANPCPALPGTADPVRPSR